VGDGFASIQEIMVKVFVNTNGQRWWIDDRTKRPQSRTIDMTFDPKMFT